ncbi:MAG: DegT/DnrJ/EryC1/StrS family aminotransferase [bacterium]
MKGYSVVRQKGKLREPKVPLFDLSLAPAVKRQVAATLASGWLTTGPQAASFEKAVGRLLGVRYAAAVNSATTGLYLLLRALGAGPNSEVITTPFTFVATVEAILMTGALPVFADIDPNTLTIDAEEVARKMSNRTGAILPVDMAGYPSDYDRLSAVAAIKKLPLVSDAAHAIGAGYRGKSIARIADAAVYSFYSTKNLTCGEGGMVLSRHKILVDKVRQLSSHGLSAGTYRRHQTGRRQYDAVDMGFKGNMSDIHAAVGLGQLTTFERDQARRVTIAERYLKNLADLFDYIDLPTAPPHGRHGWHLFIIKLHLSKLRITRDQFIRKMAQHGIECGVHYRPLFELTWYHQALGLNQQHFPNTAYAGSRVVSLPLFPTLKLRDVDYVCDRLKAVVTGHAR